MNKYLYINVVCIVTWSTTERREIRIFPYPSLFELTSRQRLTVKRRNRNVGHFLATEVTNPGLNESQQMFAFCDRMVKERGRMIGQYSKVEVAPFFFSGNRDKVYQFRGQRSCERTRDLMPNSG